MFYVVLNVCIICIHMITLGSPCKRHEVLVRVGMTRIAKQEVLPRVGMTRIGKQGVMARVGRTRIVMHGRLPRGKSALDRELAIMLVGLGIWLDIESDRAGRPGTKQTSYELWKGKKPNVSYFHTFRSKCYILNDRDHLGKFDAKSDVGLFLGYAINSRAYRVFNLTTKTIMESINVKIDDLSVRYSFID
ncbi:hypothetical protein Q3G72_021745 [Acer saccharum]|nr:hypothetical protein Q3G72_021745 [Acer saccharum]